MKPTIVMSLSSNKASHEWQFGKQALGVLYDCDAALHPERVGRDDTELRKKLPCDKVEDVRPLWATFDDHTDTASFHDDIPDEIMSTLFWKRTRPLRAKGSFSFASYHKLWNKILPSRVQMTADYAVSINYVGLFKKWCRLYEPRQAYLHYINEQVRSEKRRKIEASAPDGELGRRISSFQRGHFGALHEEKTFDLGCINFFSRNWLDRDIVKKLKESGIQVSDFANGSFVTLESDIASLDNSFELFTERRRVAKSIIGMKRFEIRD